MSTQLNSEDQLLLKNIEQLNTIFEDIKEGHFARSKKNSKELLFQAGSIPETYKFALIFYSISDLLSRKDGHDFDIYRYQDEQCSDLCESIGWQVLANNNPDIFSLNGYKNELISKNIFYLTKQTQPDWLKQKLKIDSEEKEITINEIKEYKENSNYTENSKVENIYSKGIHLFIAGKFLDSIEEFKSILNSNEDDAKIKSKCHYWIGRNQLALSQQEDAHRSFLLSGSSDPLSLYDFFSGQMLQSLSGLSSTDLSYPFSAPWQSVLETWKTYPIDFKDQKEEKVVFDLESLFLKKTIISSILIASKIKIDNNLKTIEDYQNWIFNHNDSFFKVLLESQIEWLSSTWNHYLDMKNPNIQYNSVSSYITWLYFINGNYLKAITFINKARNTFNPESNENNFLYFVFFPRFNYNKVSTILEECNIDPDLLYAISHQKNFFQKKYLDDKFIRKFCGLKMLLDHYNNNLVHALSAYQIGIPKTDEWSVSPLNDDPVFIELLPNDNLQDFIEDTLKNYYTLKWIYQENK